MSKADKILREVFPGRDVFTDDERRLVNACIAAANNSAPRSRMPRTDMPINSVFECDGRTLKVVRRGYMPEPKDACNGCYFKNHGRNCYGYRCSRFDRSDEENVWFVEVGHEA